MVFNYSFESSPMFSIFRNIPLPLWKLLNVSKLAVDIFLMSIGAELLFLSLLEYGIFLFVIAKSRHMYYCLIVVDVLNLLMTEKILLDQLTHVINLSLV